MNPPPFVLLVAAVAVASPVFAADPPENLGKGLRELVAWRQAQPATATPAERKARLTAQYASVAKSVVTESDDAASVERVIVDVKLDGAQPVGTVRARLEALGAKVTAVHDAGSVGSVISARLPLERVTDAATSPGVFSVNLVHRPIRRVGKVTSQGAGVVHSNVVNGMGYLGAGITVGVLSDSFNRTTPTAAADIAGGDLPGPGNPDGYTQPVYVLAEGSTDNTDEGRAMLQIVHDIAPAAQLAFAAVGDTQQTFADRIRALRTDPNAHCDILVDDISFPDEPFFYDGPIAQAVDDVVHSGVLNGHKVLFYSAAGNDGGAGWADDFRMVADADARAGIAGDNLKLSGVPDKLTDGGFENFDARPGKVNIAQKVTVSGADAIVTLEWDDPSIAGLVTTDYNILVFDVDGNYLTDIDGGSDNNLATGEAVEIFDLPLAQDGSDTTYQFAISRRNVGTQQATHLRYLAGTEGNFQAQFSSCLTPTIYGHSAARGVDAVAAYDYSALNAPESYTSLGPVTVYFDRDGARLPAPDVRQQPTIAAPDRVDTSFFPAGKDQDFDNDGFPNFPGTSAAAPHAAGVAALLLQAAGGSGKLDDVQARALLESTAAAHDLDPFYSSATASSAEGSNAVLQAVGNGSDAASSDPTFFRLTFNDGAGRFLRKATIDLGPAGLRFDPSVDLGFPLTFGKAHKLRDSIVATYGGDDNTVLNLKFPKGALAPGVTLEFGVDRDDVKTRMGGNSADLLAGATLTIKTKDPANVAAVGSGAFVNTIGQGYSPVDGFGLINAQAAVNKLLTSGPGAP